MPSITEHIAQWLRQARRACRRPVTRSQHPGLVVEQLEKREVLTFSYGGIFGYDPLLQNVRVENLFLGDQWNFEPKLVRQQTALNDFVTDLVSTSSYSED